MGQVVVIRDMSAGNESIGEMWKETKIFDDTATLKDVLEWADPGVHGSTRKNIVLTRPDNG